MNSDMQEFLYRVTVSPDDALLNRLIASDLPSLWLPEYELNSAEIYQLLGSLRQQVQTTSQWCKQHMDTAQLDAFALYLLNYWQMHHAPTNEVWLLYSAGMLSSAANVPQFVRVHRHLRAGGQSDFRVLYVLTEFDTLEVAFYLLALARRDADMTHYQRLVRILTSRQLSLRELALQTIPATLPNGNILVYDGQTLTFTLRADLKVGLRDAQGKMHYNLPEPAQELDAATQRAAQIAWQEVVDLVQDVEITSGIYFEQTLMDEQRWIATVFEQEILQHRLLRGVAAALIWGMYDSGGQLIQSFRIAEDFTLATIHDQLMTTAELAPYNIGIVHPLHWQADEAVRWSKILHDYGITQPFQQLDRATHALPAQTKSLFAFHLSDPQPKHTWREPHYLLEWNNDRDSHGLRRKFRQGYEAIIAVAGHKIQVSFQKYDENYTVALATVPPIVISETVRVLRLGNA
jgi:hypothetical protein